MRAKGVSLAIFKVKDNRNLRVILLGPPGAGKGTQATRIAGELGVTHAASGDLFRENLRNETELACSPSPIWIEERSCPTM